MLQLGNHICVHTSRDLRFFHQLVRIGEIKILLDRTAIKQQIVLLIFPSGLDGIVEEAVDLGGETILYGIKGSREFIAGVPILEKLAEYDVCLIVLAGFMNKISDVILQAFPGKIVNIHPALLPKYGGKGMYGMHVHEAVVKAGERESGITIHYINEHYDEGAIIFQASCPVLPSDTPEEVASKVHALEYAHYPHVIESLL